MRCNIASHNFEIKSLLLLLLLLLLLVRTLNCNRNDGDDDFSAACVTLTNLDLMRSFSGTLYICPFHEWLLFRKFVVLTLSGRAAKPACDAYLKSYPGLKNNKMSHKPNCSENLEVYRTAGINFDFSGQSAQFKMASKMAANFRTTLEI